MASVASHATVLPTSEEVAAAIQPCAAARMIDHKPVILLNSPNRLLS